MSVVLPLLIGPAAGVVLAVAILAVGRKPRRAGFFAKASMDWQHLAADQRKAFLNHYEVAHQKLKADVRAPPEVCKDVDLDANGVLDLGVS